MSIVLDVIKYCDYQGGMKIAPSGGNSDQCCTPLIEGLTSNKRCPYLIGCLTSNQRSYLQSQVSPPIGSTTWLLARGVTGTHMWDHTGVHIVVHNHAKGMEQTWGVRWTCINALMHVHILTKEWYQKRGDKDIHKRPHRGLHVCIQLCQ